MSILFVGNANLGGSQMRGRDVADRLYGQDYNVKFCDWSNLPTGPLDTVVVVKYWTSKIIDLRNRCRLLIGDPLDCFTQTHPKMVPEQFWSWYYEEVKPDVILATSPACVETMKNCGAKVVLAPHHADERVGTDWYDPKGPVVYAGGERFLGDERPKIEAACKELGLEFVCRSDKECWQALKGAALSLCVRFGSERTALNRACKPTVKVANAARARIAICHSDDSAIWSLPTWRAGRADIEGIVDDWILRLDASMTSEPPEYPWTLDTHCELLRSIAR